MENENLKPKKIFETTREKDSLHTGEQCSTLVIKEMQLKPTVRHHFTPTNTVNLEKPDNPRLVNMWDAQNTQTLPKGV